MQHICDAVGVFIVFLNTTYGIGFSPYLTYRDLIKRSKAIEVLPVFILSLGYFALASAVKIHNFRPFLMTAQFVMLVSWSLITYILVSILLWFLSRVVGGTGNIKSLAVGWAYTLIPTILWFLSTSLLYIVLPPPRTTAWQGILFSLAFLIFSATLLFWKIMLGYLTLRFSMRLDLIKILAVALISAPILGLYSYMLYKVGVFKVPFI